MTSGTRSIDTDVLYIRCPTCDGELTVQCGPQDESAGPQDIRCVFCGHVEARDVNARVLWVTGGHDPLTPA